MKNTVKYYNYKKIKQKHIKLTAFWQISLENLATEITTQHRNIFKFNQEFHSTDIANPQQPFAGISRCPIRGNKNQNVNENQASLQQPVNQENQLIIALPMRPVQAHAVVKILTQMQQFMKQSQCQPISADMCVTLPQHHFDKSNLSSARNHWTSFEIYIAFKQEKSSISTVQKYIHTSTYRYCMELIWTHYNWYTRHGQCKRKIP